MIWNKHYVNMSLKSLPFSFRLFAIFINQKLKKKIIQAWTGLISTYDSKRAAIMCTGFMMHAVFDHGFTGEQL